MNFGYILIPISIIISLVNQNSDIVKKMLMILYTSIFHLFSSITLSNDVIRVFVNTHTVLISHHNTIILNGIYQCILIIF